jgi:hypothetical protein
MFDMEMELCDAKEGTYGMKKLKVGIPILFLLFPRNEKPIGNILLTASYR